MSINEHMEDKNKSFDSELAFLSDEIQKMAQIGGWELDLATGDTKWTNQVYEIHKIPVGTPTNKVNGISFYAPEDQPRITKFVEDCAANGTPYNELFKFIDAEGNHKFVRAMGRPVKDKDGKITKLVGTFQDVTEAITQSNEIKESRQYFQLAIAGANLGIWDWYLTDNSVKYDERWASILGIDFPTMEMHFKTWEERMHPEDLPKALEAIDAYMNGRADDYEIIFRMKHTEGHWVYILARGQFSDWDEEGNPTRFTGTHLDVTDAHQLQKEQTFILSSMDIGVWTWDMVSDSINWDDNMFKLHGKNKGSFNPTHDTWVSLLRKESDFLNKETDSSGNLDAVFEIDLGDGDFRHLHVSGKVEIDENKKPQAMYGICWDVTNEENLKRELEQSRNMSIHNSKLASIGELAAGVGHEINNPLAIIKGYLNKVKKLSAAGNLDPETLEKVVDKIDSASVRIENIVKGLRTFARSDGDTIDRFDIGEAITESVSLVKEIYQKEGIDISYDLNFHNQSVLVDGNRGKVQQILMNLISNAKDATAGQSLRIVKISCTFVDDHVSIHFADNGSGIPSEIQDKVFDPFFTTKPVNKGTGMGLSLVHGIVQEHDGTIELTSEEGQGAIFKIQIPAFVNESMTKISDLAEEDASLAGKKFKSGTCKAILADDEPEIRQMMTEVLEEIGIDVKSFESGKEALAEFMTNGDQYDLIVSDMKMPKMNGAEFLQKVREQKNLKQPKFFFITGGVNIDFDNLTNEYAENISGYFYKPFDVAKIQSILIKTFSSEKKFDAA